MADRRTTDEASAVNPAADETPAAGMDITAANAAQGEGTESAGSAGPPATEDRQSERAAASPSTAPKATVAGRVWVAIGVAVVVLVLLIIFIAENSHKVTISFLGAHGTLSLGLTMLIAALAGVVITLLVGTTRIFQLRREVRRHKHRTRTSH